MRRFSERLESNEKCFLARNGRADDGVGFGVNPNGFVNEMIAVLPGGVYPRALNDSFVEKINEKFSGLRLLPSRFGYCGQLLYRNPVDRAFVGNREGTLRHGRAGRSSTSVGMTGVVPNLDEEKEKNKTTRAAAPSRARLGIKNRLPRTADTG